MIPRARILHASGGAAHEGEPLFPLGPTAAQWRRIARDEVEACLAAERILEEARVAAEALAVRARAEARNAAAHAARDAREKAEAEFAAKWLAQKSRESERLDAEMDRIIGVATVLAERLVGASLELHPERIVDLTRAAIAEARGARRVRIEAHPLDAEALKGHLGGAHIDVQSVEICENQALARGELQLQTDVGTIDAKLAPRLERLATALRDALR